MAELKVMEKKCWTLDALVGIVVLVAVVAVVAVVVVVVVAVVFLQLSFGELDMLSS